MSQSVFGHPSCKLSDRRLIWAQCSSRDGLARGEAPLDALVQVPGESVCDGSRVPSRCPLVCRMEAISFLFDLSVIIIVNNSGQT